MGLVLVALFSAGCAASSEGAAPDVVSSRSDAEGSSTGSSEAELRDRRMWPFSVDSPWNTPVGRDANFADALDETTRSLRDPAVTPWVNSHEWSHPVERASTADPLVEIDFESTNLDPFKPGHLSLHLPADAVAAAGTDRHLHVIDPTGMFVHEFFNFQRDAEGATADYYVKTDLAGTGMGQGGTRAYGGSALGGLIRTWELERGEIRHALALALENSQLRTGFTWPAVSEDDDGGSTYEGTIRMGALVAIPPWVHVEGMALTDGGLILARALQDYGAYVVDRASSMTFAAEPGADQQLIDQMRSDLPRIRRELRVIWDNYPDRIGGMGQRVADYAPELAPVGQR